MIIFYKNNSFHKAETFPQKNFKLDNYKELF